MSTPLDSTYWDNRYRTDQTGWDIGYPSTPLKTYIDQLEQKDIAILVPGCGNGYEVEYLLQKGFNNITAIDISSVLTKALAEKLADYLEKELTIITGDFFELQKQYDIILEQTFFCALDPSFRQAYAKKVRELLKPTGKIVGVLFSRDFEVGPPFGGSETEYRHLFAPLFHIAKMEACYNSIPPRQGTELFISLVKEE